MARPKKLQEERLTERIKFDVRRSDFLHASEEAEKAGMTLTAYARQQFLHGRVVVKETRSLDFAASNELRRMGVNLNQIARKIHQTGKIPPELSRIFARIEQFLMENVDDIKGQKGPKL